jgi:hypothetical protein
MKAFLFMTELVSESLLPGKSPLALLPLIDRPLVQHQIETLVELGVTQITLFTISGAERLRALLGDGGRWGCSLSIQSLSISSPLGALRLLPDTEELILVAQLERLITQPFSLKAPLLPTTPESEWSGLCVSPARLLRTLPETLPLKHLGAFLRGSLPEVVLETSRIDSLTALLTTQYQELTRRFASEVHIARSARVHPRARLIGPVWIGPQCRIGAGVVLGPNVCLGAGCIVERSTRIQDALIAPGSYIGAELELNQVYVDRSRLINLRQDVGLTVEDGFLLGVAPTRRLAFSLH